MITSVSIENFRGVREGKVEGLAPISILVGPNNAGKSTVLEAIGAVGFGADAGKVARFLIRRGGPPLDALARVVGRSANRSSIAIAGDTNLTMTIAIDSSNLGASSYEYAVRTVRIPDEGLIEPYSRIAVRSTNPTHSSQSEAYIDVLGKCSTAIPKVGDASSAPFRMSFVDVEVVRATGALENAYTHLEETGQLQKVIKALRRSMPGLADLRILKVSRAGTDFVLNTFFDEGPPVPAYLAGDGFKRFLQLAAVALDTPRGVVLLEEPESFQHPRYLEELATLLLLAAREGTQIILSTHSFELIDLLLHAPEAEGQSYPAVHRLRLHEGKLRATSLPRENALLARDELLEDLRA